ncbi:MAG TPA: MBL fold metallo-hydrolase, partial [Allosphingosinicella sp.]|nr:MBL fold metallo-hydrolase [Allosphingosinicella sp.]
MTSSRAESTAEPASPDVSLTDPGEAYSHKGLTYPLGRRGPAEGELIALADGVAWARLPIPGSLRHINVWILDDRDGVALVDTGLDIPPCREAWEALFEGPLAGRPVSRVIRTHFHPDHIGLAGWLTDRFGVPLWMTRGEWLFARTLTLDVRDTPPAEAAAYQRAAGW